MCYVSVMQIYRLRDRDPLRDLDRLLLLRVRDLDRDLDLDRRRSE